jgi:K+-sensing histidine kinase KdpD
MAPTIHRATRFLQRMCNAGVGDRTSTPAYNHTVRWFRYVAAVVSVVILVASVQVLSNYARVAGPLLLLDVVMVARFAGLWPALVTASAAAFGYSYYFLAPRGFGFGIYSPDDWFAFVTFTVTAFVAGELASRAERRAVEARRLYRELQAAFDRASEAEAARRNEQLKATLLDALTHNLRTPLTAIKMGVTALIRAWGEPTELSEEGRRELLRVIDEETDRLNRFIEGLSTSDQSQTEHPIHLRAVTVDDLVRRALARAANITKDHQIVLEVDHPLPNVSVDPASVVEAIYIVLDNATNYARRGTRIVVRARHLDNRYAQLTISDEGRGIPPEFRERVFEKFFRVPGSESQDRRGGGVGLGLPIARRLVETQGGRIRIEAAPHGVGTTVVLTLPLTPDEQSTTKDEVVRLAAEQPA